MIILGSDTCYPRVFSRQETIFSDKLGRSRTKRRGDERGCRKRLFRVQAGLHRDACLLSLSLPPSTRWELNLWMNEAKGERGLAHALYHNRNLLGLVTPACHNMARHRARLKRSQRFDGWMNETATHSPIAKPHPSSSSLGGNHWLLLFLIIYSRVWGERVVVETRGGSCSSWTRSTRQRWSRRRRRRREWTKGARGRSLMKSTLLPMLLLLGRDLSDVTKGALF